ncbi:MAG: ABC transporter permease [Rickettsiales bacterium]|nr:MAG: ABC transporter permease [Rickettsiales bacterium]
MEPITATTITIKTRSAVKTVPVKTVPVKTVFAAEIDIKNDLAARLTTPVLSQIFLSFILFLFALVASNTAFAKAPRKKLIAITQIVEHPSLEQAKRGILDELKNNGYEIGVNLKVIEKSAQGSIANSAMIAKKFVSLSPDAIVAISTPSAQSVLKIARKAGLPVVFSSVTDPVAAGLVKDLSSPVNGVTGAMDYPLIDEGVALIQTLLPKAKTIGFLYNVGEANSVKTVNLMKKAMDGKFKYIDAQLANSNQIVQAVSALVGRVDAVYIPSDNMVFSAMPKLIQLSRKHKLPIFSSDPDSVRSGVVACIGYSQYAVGKVAGKLLVRVLAGEREIAIEKPSKAEIFVNKKSAYIMNIEIPSEILGIKTNIVGK